MKRKYGMTAQKFDALFKAQGGVCAICRKPETRTLRYKSGDVVLQRLAVDHDHKTKIVRGLLCSKCNRGIGWLGDDPQTLRAAAIYVEEYAKYQTADPKEVLN